jgi:hypothetical protein
MLGQPVWGNGSKLVQTRRPLPTDQEEREDDGDRCAAQNEHEPNGHSASWPIPHTHTSEQQTNANVVGDGGAFSDKVDTIYRR